MPQLLGIDETLNLVLKLVDTALVEDGYGTGTVATTIADPMIVPGMECSGSELWGHFMESYRGDMNDGREVRNRRPCMPGTWWARYKITLARCFPTLDEQGMPSDPQDRAAAARTLHDDAALIKTTLECSSDFEEVPLVERINVVAQPSGGVSFLTVVLRTRVSMGRAHNPRPTS